MKTANLTAKYTAADAARRTKRISPVGRRPDGVDEDDPRWLLAQRVAASRSLGRSELLSNFLLFVSHRYLAARIGEINEQQIGSQVFGRAEGYSSGDDNIVRNYARMLRKRIDDYFATEGREETLTLAIPRGGYVPVFSPRNADEFELSDGTRKGPAGTGVRLLEETNVGAADPPAHGIEDPIPPTSTSDKPLPSSKYGEQRAGWAKPIAYFLLALTLVGAGAWLGFGIAKNWFQPLDRATRINRAFWHELFDMKRDTFIVPADGGLVMLQSFIRRPVPLSDYASGGYRSESVIMQGIGQFTGNTRWNDPQILVRKIQSLASRRYTSMADLDLAVRFSRIPDVTSERISIRFARDLRMDDLRGDNVILIGSVDSNPWVELFQGQLNFQFSEGKEFGGSPVLVNRHPLPGERATYASESNDPAQRTYGVIAYVPNLNRTGHVLIVEGINMAGTQAAGALLLEPEEMRSILERATGTDGGIRPFEVLVGTESIAANSSQQRLLSVRVAGR